MTAWRTANRRQLIIEPVRHMARGNRIHYGRPNGAARETEERIAPQGASAVRRNRWKSCLGLEIRPTFAPRRQATFLLGAASYF